MQVAPCERGVDTLLLGCWSSRCAPVNELDTPTTLAAVWRALMRGEFRVVRHFESPEQLGLVLAKNTPARALGARQRHIIERALTSSSQKSVSLDDDVAASTITSKLSQALQHVGVGGVPSRAPFLLAVAACAAKANTQTVAAPGNDNAFGGSSELTLLLHTPDAWLTARLTRAEREIVRARLAGATHVQIAERRERSPRTIANQLASAFRKLRVSGRAQLMVTLANEYLAGSVAIPMDGAQMPEVHRQAVF